MIFEGHIVVRMCQGGKPDMVSYTHLILVCIALPIYENGCIIDGVCAMTAD